MLSLLACVSMPAFACAQGMGNMQMPQMGPVMGATSPNAAASADPPLAVNESYVSFLDSAVPRNIFMLRFDGAYNNRQPARAGYLFPNGGMPGTPGFQSPETRVDTLQLTSVAEYSLLPYFSVFMEAPYRWINPEVNPNQNGAGDISYGFKLCTWSSDGLIATILFRVYQPTAVHEALGTGHWRLEPGLLVDYQISPSFRLEGEFRYWTQLGSSDFGGDFLRYGLGLSYGARKAGFWFVPVAEAVGYSILSGKTMQAFSPEAYIIQDARGECIVNTYLGLHLGYGPNIDLYMGYGRSLTGDFWNRDTYRVELRLLY
ncbi:MAG TPA: transporter [Gemmataceae bacterium]|nr:transporter [Gemmataceae bacterium]